LPPVLLSLAASIGLALGWAMHRFRQEEVLFREGQRGRAGRWLRRRAGARET
jgi:hypothetical protein